jgi:Tfp pilus assembly protein PilN
MSVRVNLLPEATRQRGRASQQRSILALAAVLLLAVLGGVYWWANDQVNQAEDVLADEEAETSRLRGEQAELVAFQDLADRRERSDALLIAAMDDEVSMAGILQDVAAVMPSDTQLETFVVTLEEPDPETGETGVGAFNLSGRTLTSHAPGVERVLMQLDKVVSFRELYLNSSILDLPDEDVATFSLDGQIGPEATTGRYTDGLPEELR